MPSKASAKSQSPQEGVAAYKRVLRDVLDNRPSGTRQRLAEALQKNRSFISLISNPSYPTPIPLQHVDRILEICHFAPRERDRFLAAYRAAHPRRLQALKDRRKRQREITIALPDLGTETRNRRLEALVKAFAQKAAQLLREPQ